MEKNLEVINGAEISNAVIVPGTNLSSKLIWLQSNVQSNYNYIIEVSTNESIGAKDQDIFYNIKSNITVTEVV